MLKPTFPPSSPLQAGLPPQRTVHLVSALALAAALLLTLAGCGAGQDAKPAASAQAVGVVTLASETLSLSTELPGRTNAPLVAEIRPQVGGLIKARSFSEGGAVKAGQALYQIDPASYQAAHDSARAAVAKAEATLESARLTEQRQAGLFKIEAVSKQDLQDAQATLKQAQADLAAARAAADTARINLERTTVKSPIAGLADVSSVTTGALVSAEQSTALTTVRQNDPMQVDISQSSAEWLRLQRELASGRFKSGGPQAASVRLILEDGSSYARAGRLSVRGVSVNTSTGAVTLRALFDNPDGLLLPGMYVRAVLQTQQLEQALLVPQQAVTRDSAKGSSVLVLDAQNQVQRRTVTLDRVVGNRWLVSDGLRPGERVIVEGGQKVKVGERVQAHDAQTVATAAAAASAAASAASASTATQR